MPRLTLPERFWAKVRKGPGCWEWQAGTGTEGYGLFAVERVMVGKGRSPRGRRNAHAKLSEGAVRAIRSSSRAGVELARRYGVSPARVSGVRSGKAWAHVR